MKALEDMSVRGLFDELVAILRGSKRPDPAGDLIDATRAEEREKREAH